jgi:hypothetical protein
MTIRRIVFVAAILALGTARAAEDACSADVEKLCAGIPPGGGRVLSCLKANEAKVSSGCKKELAALKKNVKAVGAACEGDVYQYCPNVKPGHGEVMKCLSSNSANLTPECQQVVQGAQEKAHAFKKACGGDAKKFCQGIPAGQGRILACLKSKQADLSPGCQAMMSK